MEQKELICVNCPMGCRLQVKTEGDKVLSVNGNHCPRGREYAEKECIRPERILTTTVRILNAAHRVLPVITEQAIPLDMIMDAMQEAKQVKVEAPVQEGDIVLPNIAGTGVNLVASRSMGQGEEFNWEIRRGSVFS